jgi:hypothetical protein
MRIRTILCLLLALVPGAGAWARDAADPGATVPPAHYRSILSGTRSFRPVEPMPWGDVNRRVAPADATTPSQSDRGVAGNENKPAKQHGH